MAKKQQTLKSPHSPAVGEPPKAERSARQLEDDRHRTRIIVYLAIGLIACLAAGSAFLEEREAEPIYPSSSITRIKPLSDFLPSLKDSRGDTDIYMFQSSTPGGKILVLGGTHPNEPASNITATILVENLKVEQGTVYVIPRTNNSGFTATEPQEAFPPSYTISNRVGKPRKFRVGSRFTNFLDGWPDPTVYAHYPSGQILSGNETRNLNRAYPGRANGTMTERIAYAITELIRQEGIDVVIDLHEAAPEYPVINALVAHENAMDVAATAVMSLSMEGINIALEPSPANFRGLSHRELGDATPARAVLLESTGALQGRLRGVTNAALITKSVDPLYHKAATIGKLRVEFPEEGVPLEERVGRHLQSIKEIITALGEMDPEKAVVTAYIPGYAEIQQRKVGFYLK